MASSRASEASSGYSSQQETPVNPHYACYWLDSCCGRHELDRCSHWDKELVGQVATYYSSDGIPHHYDESNVDVKYNPTGCTKVHVLIYTIRSRGEKEILFGSNDRHNKLVFPSSKPHHRGESSMEVARRALEWITEHTVTAEQGLKARFLFHDANIIHPLCLTQGQADLLTQKFIPSEQIRSLHWFSLETVLQRLPETNNPQTGQVMTNEPDGIQLGEHRLWPLTARLLMRIRDKVSGEYEVFLE